MTKTSRLTPENLRATRTSVKWATAPEDVLPMFIAEMDYEIDQQIQDALIAQIKNSDLGYTGNLSELVAAFSDFADKKWGWKPDQGSFFGAPDVSFGVKAALRHSVPAGGRVALTTPVYPSFFGYLKELGFECVEVPLIEGSSGLEVDTASLTRLFAAEGTERVHALILSNPHNPHGIVHSKRVLEDLARASAATGALIVSDEIHAPLVHDPGQFNPFAPIAEALRANSVIVTSASKGWNIAGTKCAIIYAPETIASREMREYIDLALGFSVSILGRTASTVAFRDCSGWLETTIERVQQNTLLLDKLLKEHLPEAKYTPPMSSYLGWINLRDCGLGENPAETLFKKARVMVSDGRDFGETGSGYIRLNLGCSPEVLTEAIERIKAASRKG